MDSHDLDHPANAALCRRLKARGRFDLPALLRPHDVSRPHETLGTHPDLVERLWDEITVKLPRDCRFVVCGTPALVHPETGIVFGFALGTHTYALRLPDEARREALAAGAVRVASYPLEPPFDLDDIGPEWVFCRWFEAEAGWCLAAYELAAGS